MYPKIQRSKGQNIMLPNVQWPKTKSCAIYSLSPSIILSIVCALHIFLLLLGTGSVSSALGSDPHAVYLQSDSQITLVWHKWTNGRHEELLYLVCFIRKLHYIKKSVLHSMAVAVASTSSERKGRCIPL